MQLGENIYRHRTNHNLSQGALAEALEVSRQSVSKWENGSATPELDKLIRMSALFHVSIDELVFGQAPVIKEQEATGVLPGLNPRVAAGLILMLFGMVFFLLSVFWGNHLRLGEEFGELLSITIVLISTALIATYHWPVFAICASFYMVYGVVCAGILKINDVTNDLFLLITGLVLLVWFIVLGHHKSKKEP